MYDIYVKNDKFCVLTRKKNTVLKLQVIKNFTHSKKVYYNYDIN